jgi:hypothetical protein
MRIGLKRGQPAVLDQTTLDIPMPLSAPNFRVRTDIAPGAVSPVCVQMPVGPRRFAFNVRQSESACRVMAVDVLVDDRCVRGCARRQGIVGTDRELILARPVIF